MPIDNSAPDDELTVRQYFAPAFHWWPLFILPMIVLPLIVGAISRQRAVEYTARVSVLVSEPVAQTALVGRDFVPNSRNRTLRDEAEFAAGDLVRSEVRARLGFEDQSLPKGRVQAQTDTDVLVFFGSGPTPAAAGETADTWADAYVDLRRQRSITELDDTIAEVESLLADALADRNAIATDLDVLQATLDRSVEPGEQRRLQRAVDAERAAVGSELEVAQSTINSYTRALDQLLLQRDLGELDSAFVLRRSALATTSSDALRWWLALVVSVVVGGVLGMGLVMGVSMADRRVTGPRDVDELGVEVLAILPWRRRAKRRSEASHERLASALGFLSLDDGLRAVAIASPEAGGESARTAMQLAVTFANGGRSVVLAETDHRRPELHQTVGIDPARILESTNGSGHVEPVEVELSSLGQQAGRLAVVPAAVLPVVEGDVLAVPQVMEMVGRWVEAADVVIVEGPPVLKRSETPALASHLDGVVLVARAGSTIKADLAEAVTTLGNSGNRLFGVALIDDGLPLKWLRRLLRRVIAGRR